MSKDELFSNCEISAPMLRRLNMISWRKTLTIVMLLVCAPGFALAQWFDSDDAFLPSPVVTVSTVPPNGDVNPYGVAFVPKNFQSGLDR